MIRFPKEKALMLHRLMAKATGGSAGVRDEGLLESALDAPYAGFAGRNSTRQRKRKAPGWAMR